MEYFPLIIDRRSASVVSPGTPLGNFWGAGDVWVSEGPWVPSATPRSAGFPLSLPVSRGGPQQGMPGRC